MKNTARRSENRSLTDALAIGEGGSSWQYHHMTVKGMPTMELTRRELDALKLLASGYTSEQIANVLGVPGRIIATSLQSIWGKLDGGRECESESVGNESSGIRALSGRRLQTTTSR